jgi:hypothetical protein
MIEPKLESIVPFAQLLGIYFVPNVFLQALSSKVSDHCPLLIAGQATVQRFSGFRFEAFWPKLPGFQDVVAATWAKNLQVVNPFSRLHTKLQRTSRALRTWARGLVERNKILLKAASILIGILDVVQDYRQLSAEEIRLKRDLKFRLLGMTAIEKLRARQAARLVPIQASEANSKLFYLHANARRRKNLIHSLHTEDGVCYAHDEKAALLFEHYSRQFGHPEPRTDLHSELGRNWLGEAGFITSGSSFHL